LGEYTANFFGEEDVEAKKYVAMTPPRVTVSSGQEATMTLELEEGIKVEGKLIDPKTGKAPEGRSVVRLIGQADRNVGNYSKVNADGSWVCYVVPGIYDVSYYISGGQGSVKVEKPLVVEREKKLDPVVIETK
jgi:hypothetical protein